MLAVNSLTPDLLWSKSICLKEVSAFLVNVKIVDQVHCLSGTCGLEPSVQH